MILKGMDRKTMLNCRLINSDWKAVVDSLQEKEVLSNWMNWNPDDPLDKYRFQMPRSMRTAQVVDGNWEAEEPNYLYRHAAIKEGAFDNSYNPFPSRSLCISLWEPLRNLSGWWSNNPNNFHGLLDRMEMHLFIIDYGHHLTSLALCKIKLTPDQLLKIFYHLPNLKALTLFQIWLDSGDNLPNFFNENPIVNGLPMLTQLRVHAQRNDEGLIQWLVDCCADQLVGLEIDSEYTAPISDEAPWVLEKLERLTIRQYNGNFLNNQVTLPLLKSLSINLKTDREAASILNFIKQFSTTLETLNIGPCMKLEDFFTQAEWEAYETVFPEVSSLSMRVLWPSGHKKYVKGLQLHILPKFPNLEFLELHHFFGILSQGVTKETIRACAVGHIEDFRYFQIFPNLKTVSVTNVGRDRDEDEHISVDKETFERMADERSELSGDESSDSDYFVDQEDPSSSDLD